MTFLTLNAHVYNVGLRNLGHRVIALFRLGLTPKHEDDIVVDFFDTPRSANEKLLEHVNQFKPDIFIQVEDSRPLLFLGIEKMPIPKIFISNEPTKYLWTKYFAELFDVVYCKNQVDMSLFKLPIDQVGHLPMATSEWIARKDIPFSERHREVVFVGGYTQDKNPYAFEVIEALKKKGVTVECVGMSSRFYGEAKIALYLPVNPLFTPELYNIVYSGCLAVSRKCTGEQVLIQGMDFVQYSTVDDLVESIHYFLSHEDQAEAIALRGQMKLATSHTNYQRCEKLVSKSKSLLGTHNIPSEFQVSQLGFCYMLCSQYEYPQELLELFTDCALDCSEESKYDDRARPWALLTQGVLAYDNQDYLRAYRTINSIFDRPDDITFELLFYKYVVMAAIQCEYLPKVVQALNEALRKYPDYHEFQLLKESVKLDELEKKINSGDNPR
ncbi:MAG: glycosyltransferase [Fibrobacterales bacterium]